MHRIHAAIDRRIEIRRPAGDDERSGAPLAAVLRRKTDHDLRARAVAAFRVQDDANVAVGEHEIVGADEADTGLPRERAGDRIDARSDRQRTSLTRDAQRTGRAGAEPQLQTIDL